MGGSKTRWTPTAEILSSFLPPIPARPAMSAVTSHRGSRDSQAVFHCVKCGYRTNADTNAAMNILGRALAKTGGGTALDVEDPHWRPDEASTPSTQAGSSFGVRAVKGIPRL